MGASSIHGCPAYCPPVSNYLIRNLSRTIYSIPREPLAVYKGTILRFNGGMTHVVRRRLFYCLVGLFLLIGSGLVFYAQGWRLDPGTFAVRKVGALYIHPYPSDASLSINGVPVEKGFTFFDRGTFIGNLFPKQYLLSVEREGYRSLVRRIDIRPSLVTELKYAVLIPQQEESYAQGVRELWPSDGAPVFMSATGTLRIGDTSFTRKELVSLAKDGHTALLRNDSNYFLADLQNGTTTNITTSLRTLGVSASSPNREVIALEGNAGVAVNTDYALSLFDPQTRAVKTLERATGPRPLTISDTTLAWANTPKDSATSTIVIYNLISKTMERVTTAPSGRITALEWHKDDLAVLTERGEFFMYAPYTKLFTKIANDVRQFFFSPTESLVAALERRSLEIFSLDGTDSAYARFNLPDTERIEHLIWYRDNHHLFVVYPERTVLFDFDDTSLESLGTVAPTNRVSYNPKTNLFYFLKDEVLMSIEFAKK